jgi:hypothetical protein
MLVTVRRTIAALLPLFPISAAADCVQTDLAGAWRFELNTGALNGNTNRLDMVSCLVSIASDGTISPKSCTTLNVTGAAAGLDLPKNWKLSVASNCEVSWTGPNNSNPNFSIQLGNTSYFFDGFRLTLGMNKDNLLGYMLFNGKGTGSVSAVHRK